LNKKKRERERERESEREKKSKRRYFRRNARTAMKPTTIVRVHLLHASRVNIGPQCANIYYIFPFVVLTGHNILYYYIPHYHICVFIILDKHHFGRKIETINLSFWAFWPRKYIFISTICRFGQTFLVIKRIL